MSSRMIYNSHNNLKLTVWTVKVVHLITARLVGVYTPDEFGTIIRVDEEAFTLTLELLLAIG